MHPDTDTVLAAIAAADPDGIVVLFLSERPRSMVMLRERLRAAFFAAGARPDRQLRFIPMVARARFLEVCAACDVMVDTPHWSGGNTTIDALVAGLPVVTVPGAMMRGRQSMAMLKALGLDELVCTDAAAQVRMALQVAREPALHAHITQRVGSHLPDLLGGAAALAALRAHFATLLTGCGAFRA
jgi:CRISPR-associated protein Csy1